MTRRSRTASVEEETLFRSALKDAKPIKKRTKVGPQAPRSARIIVAHHHYPAEPRFHESPAPAIGGHTEAHLRRGRLDPEARIDLHGLTQEAAYRSLLNFLTRAQAQGEKLVLVITGKGGILRTQLPLWLGQPDLRPLVAGLNSAHVRHGGAGAFYVLLRKQERRRASPK
jgi:DNA-nicking Smr family endonuclease